MELRCAKLVLECNKNHIEKKGYSMNDIMNFDKMLTPKIITFIYWLLLIGVVIGSLGSMFGGYDGFTIKKFFMGIVIAIGGAIGVRVWCELMIVVFKMNEALQEMRQK